MQLLSQSIQVGLGGGNLSIQSPAYFTDDPGAAFGRIYVNGGESVFYSLGFSNAFQFNGRIKFNIPFAGISVVSSFAYASLNGSTIVSTSNATLENPNPNPIVFYPTDVQIDKSLFTAGIGVQWKPLPTVYSPYIMSEILVNSYGKTLYKFQSLIREFDAENEGMTRYGASFGAGIEIIFYENLSLDVGAKYNFDSFINKIKDEDEIKSYSIYALFLYSLEL
jgi:hypothetical protein